MMTIEARDVYVKAEGHEFSHVPDGYVIYQSDRDRVHFLNPTAVIVYELCDGRHSVDQIGRFLQKSYALSAPPMAEVESCVADLLKEAILRKSA